VIHAGAGDDMLVASLGIDTLDGGSGGETRGDTVSYALAASAVATAFKLKPELIAEALASARH